MIKREDVSKVQYHPPPYSPSVSFSSSGTSWNPKCVVRPLGWWELGPGAPGAAPGAVEPARGFPAALDTERAKATRPALSRWTLRARLRLILCGGERTSPTFRDGSWEVISGTKCDSNDDTSYFKHFEIPQITPCLPPPTDVKSLEPPRVIIDIAQLRPW